MRKHAASADDEGFRQAFEACRFPPADFDHRAHVRLAYVYLVDHGVDDAVERMRNALHAFLTHNGVDISKYHETITRAWIMAVRHFMEKDPGADAAGAFIDANPMLLDSRIMLTHYSAELLFSDTARARFVEPDRDPIPEYDR